MSLLDRDRPHGILSGTDRDYLFGEIDWSDYSNPENTLKQRRHQLRQRLQNALLDLVIINNLLSEYDQARAFSNLADEYTTEQYHNYMIEIIDLITTNLPPIQSKEIVATGLERSYRRQILLASQMTAHPNVEITIDRETNTPPSTQTETYRFNADRERLLVDAMPNMASTPPRPGQDLTPSAKSQYQDRTQILTPLQETNPEIDRNELFAHRLKYIRHLSKKRCDEGG